MRKTGKWHSYNDLAWTELILSPPGENEEEVEALCGAMIGKGGPGPKTLLHLGCGAGVYDRIFKRHFTVTGVDISEGMLRIARRLNTDVRYVRGDMREVRLGTAFDAVAIPDSIDYMTTVRDLGKAIETASIHLKPGGVFLIVAHLQEQFRENNFIYEGRGRGACVTVFENNALTRRNGYEATLVYLIRRKKGLEVFSERHVLGLFSAATWNGLLKRKGFRVLRRKGGNDFDRFMLQEGEYPQVVFICRKAK